MSKRLRSGSTEDSITHLSEMPPVRWGSIFSSINRSPFCSNKDRISDLPDPILCHILSFLPTKLTVLTSILSKRWKTIYPYVPSYIMYTPFIRPDHVWSALQCRDIKLPLPLFRLYCNEPEVFNPLIMAAIQRGVETLELNLLSNVLEKTYLSNILTSKSLTVLKLTTVMIKQPDLLQINISSIKTLHLNNVSFCRTTYMINFFLSFTILEELQTNNLYLLMVRKVIPQSREVIKCLLNLVKANISDIRLIPFLSFSKELIHNVKQVPLITIAQLPIFYNLTKLELFFNFKQTWQEKWKWILKLLQQSHKLQHLIIHDQEIQSGINDENWEEPQIVPECLSSQLRTCLFRNYRGKSAELQFAGYVMRNSKVLLTMTIHSTSSIDSNTKYQILQKLSVYPRGCNLIFD